jgi:hypothetical protein
VWRNRRRRGQRNNLLPKPGVLDPKLQNYVNDLYKGTAVNPNRIGTGSGSGSVATRTFDNAVT